MPSILWQAILGIMAGTVVAVCGWPWWAVFILIAFNVLGWIEGRRS